MNCVFSRFMLQFIAIQIVVAVIVNIVRSNKIVMEKIKKTGKKKKEDLNSMNMDANIPVDRENDSSSDETKTTAELPKKDYLLRLNETHTEASLTLYYSAGHPFSLEELIDLLNENDIVYGIEKQTLAELAEGKHAYEEAIIARGIDAKDGSDGFYEYYFNTQPETRPIILPDGSVDYNVLGKIELVKSGELLATYHPAVPAAVGTDVHGNVIDAYEGKNLPPLQCKRCEPDENLSEYHASVEGNVTLENNVLIVTPIYLIEGNLDAATGNVNFYGDVLVEGNVFAGVTVKATGNITVNGHVETASLIAGKDVILKNGMQGAGSGMIRAGRNVMARFLEQIKVSAGNEINTGALLNCDVESGNTVIVTGKKGTIIGGTVMAVEQISAASIGNRVGLKTNLIIGLEQDLKTTIAEIDRLMEEYRNNMEEAMSTLERIAYQLQTQPLTPEISQQKTEQTRKKIHFQSQLKEISTKWVQAIEISQRSAEGKVVISGPAYAGCVVIINGACEKLYSRYWNVTFKKSRGEIRIVSNKL